jgi:hypothetical protein
MVGDIAIGLIVFFGFGGILGMGVLRVRNARARGNAVEAKGRFLFICSVIAGAAVMLIGALAGSAIVGEFGVLVLVLGAVVGMAFVAREGVSK